ncbi:MAG: ribokinase [Geminicoccaceae bacterium]|nr:MAG: ribokinase [Geminicoccaceae bacterium]
MLLVFGSLNVDLVFEVEHLPAPGETVLTAGYTRLAGGKGANQAAAAAKAGAAVRMAGAVGNDGLASIATAGLEEAGVDLGLVRRREVPTGLAVIGVERSGENSIIVAAGANATVRSADVADADLVAARTLLLQNEVPFDQSLDLALRAKRQGVRVVWNMAPAKRLDAAALGAIDVLVVNAGELRMVAGADGEPLALGRGLSGGHGLDVVVTLGGEGALVVTPESAGRLPALPVQVVDTTGAGDAFTGCLAASLDEGGSLDVAARRAAVAGALSCTALGAQAAQPRASRIDEGLALLPPMQPLTVS